MSNHKPSIEDGQTIQCHAKTRREEKQWSAKHYTKNEV